MNDMKWKTIDSAPKDNKKYILLFSHWEKEDLMYVGYWSSQCKEWIPESLDYHMCSCVEGPIRGEEDPPIPTHWMELPNNPK